MKKRAVLYARTNDGNTLKVDEQLKESRVYARDHGWQIVAELADLGVSGLSSEAPKLDQVLELAQVGEFDVLIVREESRLSRKLARLLAILEELGRLGIQVESASRDRDDANTKEAVVELLKPTIVYARVSDERDLRGGHGLERQIAVLQEHATRRE